MAGNIYRQQGKLNDALREYQAAIDLRERSPVLLETTAQLLRQRQRYAEADRLIRQLERERMPLSLELSRLGMDVALSQGEFDRTLELADSARKAVAEKPQDYGVYLKLGDEALRPRRPGQTARAAAEADRLSAEAEAALHRATPLGPEAPETWVALVHFLAAAENTEQSAAAIAAARAKIPAAKAPLLAQCYEAVDDPAAAQAVRGRPGGGRGPGGRPPGRRFLLSRGKPAEAEVLLRKIVEGKLPTQEADLIPARRQLAVILAVRGGYADRQKARDLIAQNLAARRNSTADRSLQAHLDASDPKRSRRDEAGSSALEDCSRSRPPPRNAWHWHG